MLSRIIAYSLIETIVNLNCQESRDYMSVEVLHYPLSTLYPESLGDILIELQDRYVGYLFLFDGDGKTSLGYISYGYTPQIGFIFKKPSTLNDYLIIVSEIAINNPRKYQSGDSGGSSSERFIQIFNLLEYLAKIESNGERTIVHPIASFDKKELGANYENDSYNLDIEALSKSLNRYLLNQLPAYLLNPTWKYNKPLFESAKQVTEIMNAKTDIHNLLGRGCYGLPQEMHSQMFAVWETGETKPSNLNFLEMARKLRIFLDQVNHSQKNKHLKGFDNVYSALSFCSHDRTMKPALILSDDHDHSRIEIIPSGWDNDNYVQRLPNTEHFDYNGIKHDGSAFKLFRY